MHTLVFERRRIKKTTQNDLESKLLHNYYQKDVFFLMTISRMRYCKELRAEAMRKTEYRTNSLMESLDLKHKVRGRDRESKTHKLN